MGVELMNAPGSAWLPMAGSPSIHRAILAASSMFAPNPNPSRTLAFRIAPESGSTSKGTIVVPSDVQMRRFRQKLGSAVASNETSDAFHFSTGLGPDVSHATRFPFHEGKSTRASITICSPSMAPSFWVPDETVAGAVA